MRHKRADYVVFIVPERHHGVRRLHVTQALLRRAVAGAIGCVALAMFFVVHYAYTVTLARAAPALLAQNVALGVRLTGLQHEIDRLDAELGRIDALTARVRAITQLNDPARNLALGPLRPEAPGRAARVLYAQGERTDSEDEIMDNAVALRLVEEGLDANREHAGQAAQAAANLDAYLGEHLSLVATTPSVRPVQSRLVSGRFGPRRDPFTGLEVMHKGLDFLADLGADVYAPADGRVIFCGPRGAGYGDTLVLDHGYGVQTLFAHLVAFRVAEGAWVSRGQVLAAVGQSGRSTGAHLHYEVRFGGLPYNPERFILDD